MLRVHTLPSEYFSPRVFKFLNKSRNANSETGFYYPKTQCFSICFFKNYFDLTALHHCISSNMFQMSKHLSSTAGTSMASISSCQLRKFVINEYKFIVSPTSYSFYRFWFIVFAPELVPFIFVRLLFRFTRS